MFRDVVQAITPPRQTEGGGFVVRRPFPTRGFAHADPFLLLDEMGPVEYRPGEAIGALDPPHRGFETVTYALEGEAERADSACRRSRPSRRARRPVRTVRDEHGARDRTGHPRRPSRQARGDRPH